MSSSEPSPADLRRWRRRLADERAEAAVYRRLAARREGEERDILLSLAEAERRHADHWLQLLGPHADKRVGPSLSNRVLTTLASRFGSVFVLALAQNAEARSPYAGDPEASQRMVADEAIHEEVVRGLAARGRARLSGNFRAAVFGANDGLVSNLALVMGMSATGVGSGVVLASGVAGLLAGALSMAAGEYISVQSARELLRASQPRPEVREALTHLDINANELALIYRSRGMTPYQAEARSRAVLQRVADDPRADLAAEDDAAGVPAAPEVDPDRHEVVGNGLSAALSSFCFFASGALVPVLPYLFGLTGLAALLTAAVMVGLALCVTGAIAGVLSGAPPLARALRQLAIGYGAAAVTYLLGLAFGATGLG